MAGGGGSATLYSFWRRFASLGFDSWREATVLESSVPHVCHGGVKYTVRGVLATRKGYKFTVECFGGRISCKLHRYDQVACAK